MKINKFIALALFLLVAISLTPSMVSATAVVIGKQYSASDPTFGDINQVASNPEHDDEAKRVINDTSLIPMSLDTFGETATIKKLEFFTISPYSLASGNFQLISTGTNLEIDNVTSKDIEIRATIPENLDAIDSDFKEVAWKVGSLKIYADDSQSTEVIGSFDVYMQRENQLRISDLDAVINDRDTENNIKDDDKIKDLKPGDSVELSVKVESDYLSKENVAIDDITLDIECPEDEGELDFDDDSVDVGDLSPGDDTIENINFRIEEDADANTITCNLRVEGTDENGARHGQKITFDVEIKRESHDIVIKDVRFNPTALTCDDDSFDVTVDMTNLGRGEEDEVAVQVQSIALGLNEKLSNLVLDVDDSMTETFIVSDLPDLADDKYAILVTTYYDSTRQTDSKVFQIDNSCTKITQTPTNEPTTYTNVIGLTESTISAPIDKLVSIKVDLTNRESTPVDYILSLEDLGGFATSTSSKTVHLNPGQTSSVFLNLKTTKDAEVGASYTGSIVLKDANAGTILETETFTIIVEGDARSTGINFANFGGENSKAFLIIINVVLVIIAIFLIKLIFSSGRKKKQTAKKVSDFEPQGGSVVIKRKK